MITAISSDGPARGMVTFVRAVQRWKAPERLAVVVDDGNLTLCDPNDPEATTYQRQHHGGASLGRHVWFYAVVPAWPVPHTV